MAFNRIEFVCCLNCKKTMQKHSASHKFCSKSCLEKHRHLTNLSKRRLKNSNYYYKNKSKLIEKKKQWRNKNRLKVKEYNIKSRKRRNAFYAKQRIINPLYKLRKNFSRLMIYSLKNINSSKNNIGCFKLTGYTKEQLKAHLENQFTKEMDWKNQGKYWDLGHRIPVSWFNNEEELIKYGWNLKNLFPVESNYNRNIQRDRFAQINNKIIYDKNKAVKELYGGNDESKML